MSSQNHFCSIIYISLWYVSTKSASLITRSRLLHFMTNMDCWGQLQTGSSRVLKMVGLLKAHRRTLYFILYFIYWGHMQSLLHLPIDAINELLSLTACLKSIIETLRWTASKQTNVEECHMRSVSRIGFNDKLRYTCRKFVKCAPRDKHCRVHLK